MKRFIFILIITICIYPFIGKSQQLSPNAEISLLTCSPGNELYTLFGHSAIRIKDKHIDCVFNYGAFDFKTPNFYMKFAQGKLKYMLSLSSYQEFLAEYTYTKRGVIEQILNLTPQEKQRIFIALINNYQPQNKFYHYDFLFDNCSTRVRDIIAKNCNGTIRYNYSYIKKPLTFWNMLDKYLLKNKWIYLGIHLALGSPCDVVATNFQQSFLPDNLMLAFNHATIVNEETNRQLVKRTQQILPVKLEYKTTAWYLRPLFLFGLLATVLFAFMLIYRNSPKQHLWIDYLLFSIAGLVGWLIIFLWFFTNHQATENNWNLLWANPIYVPLIWIFLRKKGKVRRYFFQFNTLLLIFTLAFWWAIPQQLASAVIPIIFMLLIRSYQFTKK